MKGIILAGGTGSRLYPLTLVTSKQLLPVYDKPMIYYPLSVLMLSNIKDILIISTPDDILKYENLLGSGEELGISITYEIQPSPEGLAQAFMIGEKFIGDDACAMILGDNIFYGGGFSEVLQRAIDNAENGYATILGYYVENPERFGIMEFDQDWNVISVEEKPKIPKSNYCITGLYFYPSGVAKEAEKVEPSLRGELEITTLNDRYLKKGKLKAEILGRGFAWLDTGTMDSLMDASLFVQMVEKRQGVMISALEEISYRKGWISKEKLLENAGKYGNSPYGEHLKKVAEGILKY
ncbi:MAG: glucose-1-phosphate thymidylyltransferase RfbA [Eubacteriales bacterium]|nr:glucose-1-phosphate thymidylyltransferase RfbA [Eubacteriales bacterium]